MVKAFALMAVGAAAMNWDEYKQQFGKVYNGDEDQARQQVFEQNKQMWGKHESGAVLGATVFSDLTLEEFQQLRIRGLNAGAKADLPNLGEVEILESTATIDWTTRGAVTPVKNQGQCNRMYGGGVTGFKSASSASALNSALQNGPVSVAIEADQSVFQQYNSGTITSGCGTSLDHGVLAVGINSDGSIKVKNSWGSSWGANGYVNIATNQCGIATDGSQPTVSASDEI